jgi:hypothetical protein
MPLYEHECRNPLCGQHGVVEERYFSRMNPPNPGCSECGRLMDRLVSMSHAIWLKPISDYGDASKETFWKDKQAGGHWVARKRSGGGTEEKPIKEFITSRQQQKAYCREEGMSDPSDFPTKMEVTEDGKSWANTCGNGGGSWV